MRERKIHQSKLPSKLNPRNNKLTLQRDPTSLSGLFHLSSRKQVGPRVHKNANKTPNQRKKNVYMKNRRTTTRNPVKASRRVTRISRQSDAYKPARFFKSMRFGAARKITAARKRELKIIARFK